MYPHHEQVEKILKNNEKRTVYITLKLPCGHGQVEITEPRDQWVQCQNCFKAFFVAWSLSPKITKESK